jgi:methyl-accepting chemotaxis protein
MSADDKHRWVLSGSIRQSLLKALAATTGGALALVAVSLLVVEVRTHRHATESELLAISSVIALYSEAALEFDDPDAGREALDALRSVPQIEAGLLLRTDGAPFASYGGTAAAAIDVTALTPGILDGSGHLDSTRAIEIEGRPAGWLVIRRSSSDLARILATKSALLASVMAAAFAVAFAIANQLGRRLARPLEIQIAACQAVAGGDLSVRVPERAPGELGELARAFNTMTSGLRRLVAQVTQGVAEVVAVSDTLEERRGQLASAASRQAAATDAAIESLLRASTSIREIDRSAEQLAETAEQTTSSAFEFDAATNEIAVHMDELTGAHATTSTSVQQVSASSGKIAQSAETLQQATTGAARYLEELTLTVSSVASKADESFHLSEQSRRAAEEGMSVVRDASAATDAISTSFRSLEDCVARLSERSVSIGAIVEVIRRVADETRLLSINASIIAAQAGTKGNAFSVIANEIRELAERVHQSAGEITSLIHSTQHDTSAAVRAVGEGSARVAEGIERQMAPGEVLERILGTNATSAARAREIAEATAQQARDLERAGVAVREIDAGVDAIRASTSEQQLATEGIASAVQQIRALGIAVQRSTQQQRRDSALISKASHRISQTLAQIVEATNSQSRSAATIEETLRVSSAVSTETVGAAGAISAAVETLQKRAAWLAEESARFRIGGSALSAV